MYQSTKAKIVDIGCISKISPNVVSKFPRIIYLPPTELHKIGEVLGIEQSFEDFEDPQVVYRDELNKRPFLTTRTAEDICHIVICSGCSGRCTYCVDWKSIGGIKSRPKDRILTNIQRGIDAGFDKFVFIGADIAAWGIDVGDNFVNLLHDVFAIEGNHKFMFPYITPRWFSEYDLVPVFKDNVAKVDFIHAPIQSGSNRILKLMGRRHTIQEVEPQLTELSSILPVVTYVIVGFPTETEAEFQMTVDMLKRVKFAGVKVFEYSERPDTASQKITPKVSNEEMIRRVHTIHQEMAETQKWIWYKDWRIPKTQQVKFSNQDYWHSIVQNWSYQAKQPNDVLMLEKEDAWELGEKLYYGCFGIGIRTRND